MCECACMCRRDCARACADGGSSSRLLFPSSPHAVPDRLRLRVNRISLQEYDRLQFDKERLRDVCKPDPPPPRSAAPRWPWRCLCFPQPSPWASWWWGATATWRPADFTSTGCKRRVPARPSPPLPVHSPLGLFITDPRGRRPLTASTICGSLLMLWLLVNLENCLLCLLGFTPGATYWPQSALSGT